MSYGERRSISQVPSTRRTNCMRSWSRFRLPCQNSNLSVGYWQASRIHSILGRADDAKRYAQLCLRHSQEEGPFLRAYANEALARAEKVAGNSSHAAKYHAEAMRLAESVEEADDRKLLLDDLATIKPH